MSTQVFPALNGQAIEITRTPIWKTRKVTSVSGKEVSIADWSSPRYQWEVAWNALFQGKFGGTTYTWFAEVWGLFGAMKGGYDSFLYSDADDNAVTDQAIGTGDGVTTAFQLQRTFGAAGFTETSNVYAPNAVPNVKVATVAQPSSNYSVSSWSTTGAVAGGVVQFIGAATPSSSAAITATFSYYWPCRFVDDQCAFARVLPGIYAVKKLTFLSVK